MTATNHAEDSVRFRLPIVARPTHYDLTICTDLEKLSFEGFVAIQCVRASALVSVMLNAGRLDVHAETSLLEFHLGEGLRLGLASLHSSSLQIEQPEVSREHDKETERVVLYFATPLPEGSTATLRLSFSGELGSAMLGYYRAGYEVDDAEKFYAITQFEVRPSIRSG
jgi:aminopeptidase 2